MTQSLFFIVIILASCTCTDKKPQEKFQLIKQYDYRIVIEEWNSFAGYKTTYILNNLRIATFDSIEQRLYQIHPLTLYSISHKHATDPHNENIRVFVAKDTTKTPFSKELSDTLFTLTKDFLQSVEFNNYDTAIHGTITHPIIYDDSHARVELNYGGRTLSATISSISNPTIATPELQTLLRFMGRFGRKNEE